MLSIFFCEGSTILWCHSTSMLYHNHHNNIMLVHGRIKHLSLLILSCPYLSVCAVFLCWNHKHVRHRVRCTLRGPSSEHCSFTMADPYHYLHSIPWCLTVRVKEKSLGKDEGLHFLDYSIIPHIRIWGYNLLAV